MDAHADACFHDDATALDHLGGRRLEEALGVALLDLTVNGIGLMGAGGRVRYLSKVATAIVGASDGLTVIEGRLAALRAPDQTRLLKAIDRALAADGQLARLQRAGLVIRRPSGRLPYAVIVAPFAARRPGDDRVAEPLALVTIADLDRRTDAVASRLSELFGLSGAEARIAVGIANGDPPADLAARAGVRLSTVRTQLQAVLRKTGARRQVDLVRIVHGIPPAMRD